MKLQQSHPMIRFWHYVSEFCATFIFFFVGSSAIGLFFGYPLFQNMNFSSEIRLFIVVGLIILTSLMMIYSPLGKISGAHMNPAVSFAFWLEKHLDLIDLVFYILMQIAAAILATYVVVLMIPESAVATRLGLPQPQSEHRVFIEFLSEMLSTGIMITLLFFFLSEQLLVKYAGILLGCYIFFIKLISIDAVSLNLNPAKFIGVASIFHHFEHVWIYTIGPFLGAFLAVMLHKSWNVLKRPRYFRLNHKEGYLETLFTNYLKK